MGQPIASASIDESVPTAGRRASVIAATDGELLMRFVHHRDQAAFAQVVERHGRLVWIVCRQVLRHHQDVEDAFQATFLILAQRAGTIRASDSAAAWLYKVAQRTALAARRKRSRRREEELPAEPPVGEEALSMVHDREILYVLLDELRTLPDRYQTPLVLRYFEGQSRRAIAEQTDATLAQIQGRLVRGRRLLRSRLVRRGVSLSIAAGTLGTASVAASAAVTPVLIADTATSCLTFTTSGTASGTSPAALELAKQGVKAMWFAAVIKPAAIVCTLLLAGGIVLAAQQDEGAALVPGNAAPASVELQTAAEEIDDAQEPAVTIIAAADTNESEQNVSRVPPLGSGESLQADYVVFFRDAKYKQLELERDAWRLKAEALRLKAEAKKMALESKLAPGAITRSEGSERRADALLLEADAKLAEAKALELEAQLRELAPGEEPSPVSTAIPPPTQPAQPVRPIPRLEDAIEERREAFAAETKSKAKLNAQLEMEQVEKSLLQQELEHWHELLVQLRSPVTESGEERSDEDLKRRVQTSNLAARRMNDVREKLQDHMRRTAELAAKIDMVEQSRMEHQRWLEAVERAKYEARTPDPPPTNMEPFRQNVALQIEQMHRELNALQAENAELKKQLEQRTQPTEPPPAPPGAQVPVR